MLNAGISGIFEEPAAPIFRVDWFPGILLGTHLQPSLQNRPPYNTNVACVLFEIQTFKNRLSKANNPVPTKGASVFV